MPLRSLPKTRAWSGITLGENKLLIRRVLPFLIYRQKPQSNIVRTPLVDLQYLISPLPCLFHQGFRKRAWPVILKTVRWKSMVSTKLKSLLRKKGKNTKVALGWYQKGIHYFLRVSWRRCLPKYKTRWCCLMILYPVERGVITERSAIWFHLKKTLMKDKDKFVLEMV